MSTTSTTTPRVLLVDLYGGIVGSTYTTRTTGLYQAIHPSGESWGVVEIKSTAWPRRRIRASDLEVFKIKPVGRRPKEQGK